MSYKMTELTDRVRVGRMGDGTLDVEVWERPKGWVLGAPGDVTEVLIPVDAVEALFEYLR